MDLLRAYKVLLNGKEVGRVRNGKEIELEVPSGNHHLQLKIDWCFSNPIQFEANDKLIEFECGNNYAGKRIFLGVLNVFGTQGGDYLWLRKTRPK